MNEPGHGDEIRMTGVRVISFDIGNTLIRLDGGGFCKEFAAKTGVAEDLLRPLICDYFLTQQLSLHEAVSSLCKEIGFEKPQQLIDGYRPSKVSLFEDTVPVLKQLSSKGVSIVAMSNCTPWEAGGLEKLELDLYLRRVFYSFAVGAAKPDPQMFYYVQDALGEPPENIWHVGDSLVADVNGARAVGWNAVLLDRQGVWDKNCNISEEVPVVEDLWSLLRVLQC